jgi:hypothetical protein
MRTKIIAYWTVTILIALETLVGGVTDLVHGKAILVAGLPVADIVTHLGYPLYSCGSSASGSCWEVSFC